MSRMAHEMAERKVVLIEIDALPGSVELTAARAAAASKDEQFNGLAAGGPTTCSTRSARCPSVCAVNTRNHTKQPIAW